MDEDTALDAVQLGNLHRVPQGVGPGGGTRGPGPGLQGSPGLRREEKTEPGSGLWSHACPVFRDQVQDLG